MRVLRARTATLRDLLPDELMTRVLAAGKARRYADGQIVQQRGDARPGLSIVTAGEVVAGNIGLDGSFLASALLRPGETFGEFTLFAGLPRTQTLWAQGETEITHVGAQRFMTLFDAEPAIARALLVLTLQRNYEMLEFIDAQRRLSLEAQLARLLLLAVADGAARETVACRHEDLAFMLGVSRVAAGKALERLERQGMAERQYGRVHLPDLPRLKAWLAAEDQREPIARQ